MGSLIALALIAWFLVVSGRPLGSGAILLTWQGDPSRSMTIDFFAGPEVTRAVLEFSPSRSPQDAAKRRVSASTRRFPFSELRVHRFSLNGLEPGTSYNFRVNDGRQLGFRTMPATASRAIRFASGGDTGTHPAFRKINRALIKHDPDFVIIGGDLAYGNGSPARIDRWYEWLEIVSEDYITDTGRVVPVVAAIGNHDVFSSDDLTAREAGAIEQQWGVRDGDAPYFHDLFAPAERRSFRALDFGNYLSLILLDSNHANPVAGAQTAWLDSSLAERVHMPHVIPVYHVPAWPSVRDFDSPTSAEIRRHWVPLFERHNLKVAFEHHDHVYKRTHPLRGNAISDDGVVYLGDGAMGVAPRSLSGEKRWYLDVVRSENHFILGTVDGTSVRLETFDDEGRQIDTYTRRGRGTADRS